VNIRHLLQVSHKRAQILVSRIQNLAQVHAGAGGIFVGIPSLSQQGQLFNECASTLGELLHSLGVRAQGCRGSLLDRRLRNGGVLRCNLLLRNPFELGIGILFANLPWILERLAVQRIIEIRSLVRIRIGS
jgi:hypothetical protein